MSQGSFIHYPPQALRGGVRDGPRQGGRAAHIPPGGEMRALSAEPEVPALPAQLQGPRRRQRLHQV